MNSFIDSKISKNYFMSNLIFVYGTLRWSESRNSVLSDSEYLGLFQSCPEYTMVDLGSFPGIFKQGKMMFEKVQDSSSQFSESQNQEKVGN